MYKSQKAAPDNIAQANVRAFWPLYVFAREGLDLSDPAAPSGWYRVSETEQGPPLVHETYRPGHHADLTFHWAVRDGARQHHWNFGDMLPVPNLTPEDVGHIIAFLREKQRDAGIK